MKAANHIWTKQTLKEEPQVVPSNKNDEEERPPRAAEVQPIADDQEALYDIVIENNSSSTITVDELRRLLKFDAETISALVNNPSTKAQIIRCFMEHYSQELETITAVFDKRIASGRQAVVSTKNIEILLTLSGGGVPFSASSLKDDYNNKLFIYIAIAASLVGFFGCLACLMTQNCKNKKKASSICGKVGTAATSTALIFYACMALPTKLAWLPLLSSVMAATTLCCI